MAIDVSNFIGAPQEFGGLYKAADTIEQRNQRDQQLALQREGKAAATTKFLSDYLDPKDKLTGTNYDPEIAKGFNDLLQEGAALAAKGASTADIMMALGSKVNKLNEYSTKAKLINQNIKSQLEKLKGYGGYNLAALEDEAKKMAFQDEKGGLKDISLVDPNTNWITEVTHNKPELVTTGAGFDQFVNKTPMATSDKTVGTTYAGRSRNVAYSATSPFWEDLERDDKGGIVTDNAGNPVGLDVISTPIMGDDNKPLINPQTGRAYRAAGEDVYNAIMKHNPDVADYVRGQTNRAFKEAGAEKMPAEGSPQWNMKARHILYDELKTRSKSSFKTKDTAKETSAAVKVEIAQDPEALAAIKAYGDASRKSGGGSSDKVNKTTTYADVLSGIMNNNPDYGSGDIVNVAGRDLEDITRMVPDLKYSNDQFYKKVYRDPEKNSIIVEKQSGEKEEVPEGKAYQFMNRLSGYNNLNPEYIRKVSEGSGYEGGRFANAKPSDYKQRIQESRQKEQQASQERIDAFEGSGKVSELNDFKGKKLKDGTISKIEESGIFTSGKYYIDFTNGERKTFKSKQALSEYLKGDSAKENTQSQKPAQVGDWKTRAKKL